MRKRVEALGGKFAAGPDGYGWRSSAHRRSAARVRQSLQKREARHVADATVRVLLVDDQVLVRSGLRMILCPDEGFEVVAECTDGDEVAAAVKRARPDLELMDGRMRRMDGAQATRMLRERYDAPPVMILTTFRDDEVLSAALRAGADGFLLKDTPGEEIIRAARIVAEGGAYLDPAVTARVLATYRSAAGPDLEARQRLHDLTERETEVEIIGSPRRSPTMTPAQAGSQRKNAHRRQQQRQRPQREAREV